MSKPQNCSAGGYCDCLQKLESMGYFRDDRKFLGLSLTEEQQETMLRLTMLHATDHPDEELVVADMICEAVDKAIEHWR